MTSTAQLAPAAFSLAAGLCWGTSDFSGGFASRRSDAFLVTLLSHAAGFLLMLTLSLATHSDLPSRSSQFWAAAAGFSGGLALVIFYRALAQGMGLTAPVAAVIGAAIPAAFTMITQGPPGALAIAGFLLAGFGHLDDFASGWFWKQPRNSHGCVGGGGLLGIFHLHQPYW